MPPIALITRKELLLFALFVVPCLSPAQQAGIFSDGDATANSQLNSAYSQALPRLIESQQQLFLRAQLAWTIFSDKEKALLNALQTENLVSEDFAHTHSLAVVYARTKHLQEFFVDYKINYPPQDTPQNQDQELNKIYAECFLRMTASDQRLLLSSERAWLTYRDADIDAAMATSPSQILKNATIVTLTIPRIAQLTSIVQSLRQTPIANTPTQILPPPPVQNSSPNPEDVKALAEFQNDAKAVLNAFVAKKDDPFFKKADVIKNVPGLSTEISSQISKLDSKYMELLHKPYSDKLLEPASNECAVVELLFSWSKFTEEVKAGNVVDADLAIQMAVSQKPKNIAAAYLPFWQTVGSWHDLFVIDEANFYAHYDKGNSFAANGKTSDAIKEYQAAYAIIESPTLLEKIKNLREQSLGL
jgi:uncharacterized protein YecT (DUF1311 family)